MLRRGAQAYGAATTTTATHCAAAARRVWRYAARSRLRGLSGSLGNLSTLPRNTYSAGRHNSPERYRDGSVGRSLVRAQPYTSIYELSPRRFSDLTPRRTHSMDDISRAGVDSSLISVNSAHRLLYAIAKIEDYDLVAKQTGESRVILSGIEARLKERMKLLMPKDYKSLEFITLKGISISVSQLAHYLGECNNRLRLFWTTELPSRELGGEPPYHRILADENMSLRDTINKQSHKLSSQEKLLGNALGKLEASTRVKAGMEEAIIKQLTKTHKVLKKAKSNLEYRSQPS
ncbi:PREDICTED: myomegalin-like [Priapulus caudatus]|uniref:Myomegalin-like n=1 Tax=Priapulus caudatus TaxID=37621 RepID=A0ABM1EBQ1_PRICU|nr:PREDICTED: myomegalin-like [Priapulus caudatus]